MEDKLGNFQEFTPENETRFEKLSEDNIAEFMEQKIKDFSNRYSDLYCQTLEIDRGTLHNFVQEKLRNSFDRVSIEDVIKGGEDQLEVSEDGTIKHIEISDPLTVAAFHSNRFTGESEFKFKPYFSHNDALITKTIYHEFLHALGHRKRKINDSKEEYSLGVQFDYDSNWIDHYQPFEEGFTEIIAAEMVGVAPQSYTYEVPVCMLMRQIIGDKDFLQVKNGELQLLFAEFTNENLEELRNILNLYDIGMRSRIGNIKYVDRERKIIDGRSTETIVNDYLANESYVIASQRLSKYLVSYFEVKIGGIYDQQDADSLSGIIAKCQQTEQKILPPNNYYESSIQSVNQAIVETQAIFALHCENNNLQMPALFDEFEPKYTQNRAGVLVDCSVSDLQLDILEQEINEPKQNEALNSSEKIILAAKKWIHASIEVQKKYRELYPSYKNFFFSYPRQLQAIISHESSYSPKYPQKEGIIVDNVPDYTFLTNNPIDFTIGGYHGGLPDYGHLIAHSINDQINNKIFGKYSVPIIKLGEQLGIEIDYDTSKVLLLEIKRIIAENEKEIVSNAKGLSANDGQIDIDVKSRIDQLGDLRIYDLIRLQIQ